MGRGKHKHNNAAGRKAKYTAQFSITERNKKRNIAKMKEQNSNWPEKKSK